MSSSGSMGRPSAFHRPRPDQKGFQEPSFAFSAGSATTASSAGTGDMSTNRYQHPSSLSLNVGGLGLSTGGAFSAGRSVPDTPQRPPKNPELRETKLLYSSSKKPPRSAITLRDQQSNGGNPTSPSLSNNNNNGSSSTISRRKRYKDALDATSPVRLLPYSSTTPPSPARVMGDSTMEVTSRASDSEDLGYDSEESDEEEEEENVEDDLLPAESIPHVRAIEMLGDGNFSKVVSVICLENNKKYALKESKQFISAGSRESALKELKLWDSLRHRRIIQFYRAWQEDARLYVLMRLCEGGTLYNFVRSTMSVYGAVEEQLLLAAFRDCCSALEYMHSNACVHMDVKPSNVCLSRGRAYLCDFGLLRSQGQPLKVETDHTYVAPEVWREEYRVHPSADIFALGISFFELAAWAPLPNSGPLWNELRTQTPSVQKHPYLRGHQKLFELIKVCMAFDPPQRPTAQRLLNEPCLSLKRSVKLIAPETIEDKSSLRPASASFMVSSPTAETEMKQFEFLTSPVLRASPLSKNASRGPSPFVFQHHHKRLDFSSACPSPAEHVIVDESSLSDRFTSQAVVTPRPGTATPVQQASRASSPRLLTSSPLHFQFPTIGLGAVGAAAGPLGGGGAVAVAARTQKPKAVAPQLGLN